MRGVFHVACVLVLAAAPAAIAAPPTVDVPKEVKAEGDYVTLEPKTNAKTITYLGLSGVEPFPSAFLKDPRAFVLPVRGLPAGRYSFVGVASLNDEHAKFPFTVVVGTGPQPPTPVPPPVPPGPADPLFKPVQDAFTADPTATKGEDRTRLAAVYLATADALGPVATAGNLFTVISSATNARIEGRLKPLRALFGDELAKVVPAQPDAPLTPDQKTEVAKQLKRFAAVLGDLK